MAQSNVTMALLGGDLNIRKEVPIARLKVNFTVRSINSAELEQANAQCTFTDPKGGKRFDENMFNPTLVARACVEPDFNDRAVIEHYGAENGPDCVRRAMLPGEIKRLADAVSDISGFNDDAVDFPNS